LPNIISKECPPPPVREFWTSYRKAQLQENLLAVSTCVSTNSTHSFSSDGLLPMQLHAREREAVEGECSELQDNLAEVAAACNGLQQGIDQLTAQNIAQQVRYPPSSFTSTPYF